MGTIVRFILLLEQANQNRAIPPHCSEVMIGQANGSVHGLLRRQSLAYPVSALGSRPCACCEHAAVFPQHHIKS